MAGCVACGVHLQGRARAHVTARPLVAPACTACLTCCPVPPALYCPACRKYYDLDVYEKQQAAKAAKRGGPEKVRSCCCLVL